MSLTESKASYKPSGVKAPRSLGAFPESDKVKKLRKQRAAKRALEVIKHTKDRELAQITKEVPAFADIDFQTDEKETSVETSMPPMELSIPPVELDPIEPEGIPLEEWSLDPEALETLESTNQDVLLLPPEDLSSSVDQENSSGPKNKKEKLDTQTKQQDPISMSAESFFQTLYSDTESKTNNSRHTLAPDHLTAVESDHEAQTTQAPITLQRGTILWEKSHQEEN